MFDKPGLVQFVFADREDFYFLSGGRKTNLLQKINYELRLLNVENVLYVNNQEEWQRLDGEKRSEWTACNEKRIWSGGSTQKWILNQLRNREKTGIIMNLVTFDKLFRQAPKMLGNLITLASETQENRLILVSSLNAAESLPLLAGEDSPFLFCRDDKYLSEQMQNALTDAREDVFACIREQVPACYVLNSRTVEKSTADAELRNLLTRILLKHASLDISDSLFENCVCFLFCIMHSGKLQKTVGINWDSYRSAYNSLCDTAVWQRFLAYEAEYEQNGQIMIPDLRESCQDFLEIPGGVHWEGRAGQELLSFKCPRWLAEDCSDEMWDEITSSLSFIRKQLCTPWRSGIAPELLDYIDTFREALREAAKERAAGGFESADYFLTAVDALKFCAETVTHDWTETVHDRAEKHRTMIALGRKTAEDEKRIGEILQMMKTTEEPVALEALNAKRNACTAALNQDRKNLSVLRMGITAEIPRKDDKMSESDIHQILLKNAEKK